MRFTLLSAELGFTKEHGECDDDFKVSGRLMDRVVRVLRQVVELQELVNMPRFEVCSIEDLQLLRGGGDLSRMPLRAAGAEY